MDYLGGELYVMVTSTDLQSVGGLLIGGFVVFFVGAALWKMDYQRPLPEALLAIARSPRRWRWIHTWMIAGVAITIAGLGALARLLADSGEIVYGTVGFVLFAVGGIVWLVGAAWRLTALVAASRETERAGTVPGDGVSGLECSIVSTCFPPTCRGRSLAARSSPAGSYRSGWAGSASGWAWLEL